VPDDLAGGEPACPHDYDRWTWEVLLGPIGRRAVAEQDRELGERAPWRLRP
jgi:hypothetical protein